MRPASCLHSLLPQPRSTAFTSRLTSSQILLKVHTRTKRYCSFIQNGLWRNYNFWAHPGKISLPANSLDTQIGSLWAPFIPFWAPAPRHCWGCRSLVTPLPPPVNLLSYYCLLIICLITRYSIWSVDHTFMHVGLGYSFILQLRFMFLCFM